MPRPIKPRPWTEQEQAYRYVLDSAGQIARIPETPSLCRLLIAALLGRIKKRNPKEARFLRRTIALLAGAERQVPGVLATQSEEFLANPPQYAQTFEGIFRQLLETVVTGKVPHSDHDIYTLSDQRKSLLEYMNSHPMKPSASFQDYRRWLSFHSSKLYESLSSFLCLCEYRESFDHITDNEQDLFNCRGPAHITFIVLAELHRTTPAAIRKILSHSKLD